MYFSCVNKCIHALISINLLLLLLLQTTRLLRAGRAGREEATVLQVHALGRPAAQEDQSALRAHHCE